MKLFSTSLCLGLLALLSVMDLLKCVHGQPQMWLSGYELFPAKERTADKKLPQALLTRNPGFQRPSHTGVDLPSKLKDLKQLKKLKEWTMEAKNAELSNTMEKLAPSQPNKRACFWKYCV
ncbi:urotensin-2B [Meriones unguiculatus]|uniref:urotensin-2B n=1 Tax=Meriones unguiculatus TaxID=10047 RepID=UPI000B4F5212|nr:urotensin-2B [Meriones unguiculatus]